MHCYPEKNWEQYREVFEAIVCSNGWDDVTAALQLLSHLDGDALNVALLVPESRRVKPGFLIKSLSEHYNGQAEHALRRHLDSLGPNTPMTDIVDCCRI